MNEYEVKKTWDYDMFKKLLGNRVVSEKRIGRIMESIQNVGYICSPIIVNQNYEVIDGQGRLEALKRLHMPIYYIVVEGAGFQECIAMNIRNSNWSIVDYIESYVAQGNITYRRLYDLCKKHNVSYSTALYALILKSRASNDLIKNGGLEFTNEEFEIADERLTFLDSFQDLKKVNGGTLYFQQAVMFCYQHPLVNKERLREKIVENYTFMAPWRDIQTAVDSIEEVYNRGLTPEKRIFLGSEYKKHALMNTREAVMKNLEKAQAYRKN